jgi:Tfp pilus assembly protein PilX
MKRSPENEGSATIICLMVLSLLTALGFSAQIASTTNQNIAANLRKQTQAFFVAEAGLQLAVARLKQNPLWRGDESTNPHSTQGTLAISGMSGVYSVALSDSTNDGQGIYEPHIPGGAVRLESSGTYSDSSQKIEILVRMAPNPGSNADSPKKAVITSGGNTGSGPHIVNGYDNNGSYDPNMVETFTTLPTVNQNALKTFADFSFASLTNSVVDAYLSGQTGFFKDAPANTRPWIIHVQGNLTISGNRTVHGIIFVEGTTVTLSGSVRIDGVIYAPNATVKTTINGGGSPWDQPVMGQVICGSGGVHASGNHSDVQLVDDYVDAFNNFGGEIVDVNILAGTWKQL